MGKWLAIAKLILELLAKLNLQNGRATLSEAEVEPAVRQAVDSVRFTGNGPNQETQVQGFDDIDWEEAIPHIVALVKILLAGFRGESSTGDQNDDVTTQ